MLAFVVPGHPFSGHQLKIHAKRTLNPHSHSFAPMRFFRFVASPQHGQWPSLDRCNTTWSRSHDRSQHTVDGCGLFLEHNKSILPQAPVQPNGQQLLQPVVLPLPPRMTFFLDSSPPPSRLICRRHRVEAVLHFHPRSRNHGHHHGLYRMCDRPEL